MKFINGFFWLIGLFFTGTFLHELYNFLNCGGNFVAGIAYFSSGIYSVFNHGLYSGETWCQRPYWGNDMYVCVVEVLFYIFFIVLKIRRG